MPKASNQGMGVYALAIVDSTMVEHPPGEDAPPKVDPTSYVEGIRGLFAKGVWPNKSTGAALQDKLETYVRDMALYSTSNRKRQSYYAATAPQEEIVTTGKSGMTCIAGGKYREVHALGQGAMVNSSLPESITTEAYRLVSMSISVNTAKTYRSAQSILGTSISMVRKANRGPIHRLGCNRTGSLYGGREIIKKYDNRRLFRRVPHTTPHER